MNEVSDLIQEVRNGDHSAFEVLSEHYSPLILSMAQMYASTCGADDAEKEDILQEAMVAFYQASLRYDLSRTEVSFGLYAKVCIRNRLVSYIRRRSAREALVGAERLEKQDGSEASDPLEDVIRREDLSRVMMIIHDELSPYEKKIFSLYILGRTSDEIALSIGKTKKSVSNAIYRIRIKIKGLLR